MPFSSQPGAYKPSMETEMRVFSRTALGNLLSPHQASSGRGRGRQVTADGSAKENTWEM
jgi:hypothetical protein